MAGPGVALQSDFTAGEISPAMSARVDLTKYQKGCRLLRNFMVQAHGGAVKRAGFELLDILPGEAALLPFVFNYEQAYCLVFGEGWMRVAVHDGFVLDDQDNIYQTESPYTVQQARELSFAQSADVVYLAHRSVPPKKLKRLGHANWAFADIDFEPAIASPDSFTATAAGDNLNTPTTYHVTAINEDGKESNAKTATATAPASNNWNVDSYVDLTWSAVSGAVEYRLYKAIYNGRPGYIAVSSGTNFTDRNIQPSADEGVPTYRNPFTDNDYPGCVCIFQQRLVYASTNNRPQTIWMSKTGDYENFADYKPIADDSPIELTLASNEVSNFRWMVAIRSLIIGAGGIEWEINGEGGKAFSAKNARAVPQSYWGSALTSAVIIGNIILHVSSSGSQVRNLQYDFSSDSYGGTDLSILASHLFERNRIVDWTYQKNPDSIAWAVRDDGKLLGLTFQSEHQIAAWHRHDTDGLFRNVCAVPNGFNHSLFACVERDGAFYLERMADRHTEGDLPESSYLDCSLTYEGEPAEAVGNLDHLEGKEVGILADGAVMASRVVEGGQIDLDYPARRVIVGLPYAAELETMPVEVAGQGGSSVTLKKTVNSVNLELRDSSDIKCGPSFTKMDTVNFRVDEPYGTPTRLFSGIKSVTMPSLAENIRTVCIASRNPLPCTVLALAARVKVNA